jgi:hypothetical protein
MTIWLGREVMSLKWVGNQVDGTTGFGVPRSSMRLTSNVMVLGSESVH